MAQAARYQIRRSARLNGQRCMQPTHRVGADLRDLGQFADALHPLSRPGAIGLSAFLAGVEMPRFGKQAARHSPLRYRGVSGIVSVDGRRTRSKRSGLPG